MGSALPSMAIPYMAKEWGVTSRLQMVLPISTYLMGYVFGPMVCKFPFFDIHDSYNRPVQY